MFKISELQNNDFLNSDNHYGAFYLPEELNEMSRFGIIPKSKYEIHIEGGEGFTPHMHICIKTGKMLFLEFAFLKMNILERKTTLKIL